MIRSEIRDKDWSLSIGFVGICFERVSYSYLEYIYRCIFYVEFLEVLGFFDFVFKGWWG